MNRNRLRRLWAELERLRRAPQKAAALEGLARRLGRRRARGGRHPIWVSEEFDGLRPLSIPRHANRDLPPGTRHAILNQLEDDLLAWEERLLEEDDG